MWQVVRPNQVVGSDITYVPHAAGLDVLDGGHGLVQSLRVVVAVSNHFGRAVLPGKRLDGGLCDGSPEIFNTDQGVQYTAEAFTAAWSGGRARVSMDGRAVEWTTVFVERCGGR